MTPEREAVMAQLAAALERVPIVKRGPIGACPSAGHMECIGCGGISCGAHGLYSLGVLNDACGPDCWVAQVDAALDAYRALGAPLWEPVER